MTEPMEPTNTPAGEEGSALSRMFNVLAAPGEVFAEIKERPVRHANWVVPAVIWAVLGSVLVFLLFSQDWAVTEMMKGQEQALEKMVAQGKLPQSVADQQIEGMRRYGPVFMKIGGVFASVAFAFCVPFFWGFFIWLFTVKLAKADVEFMKGVEAAGLATVIYLLAGVVGTLFSFVMGHLQTVSPAIVLKEFDFTNRGHLALAALNPFYLWYLAVVAVSVSVLGNVSLGKALLWCGVVWFGLRALFLSNQITASWVM